MCEAIEYPKYESSAPYLTIGRRFSKLKQFTKLIKDMELRRKTFKTICEDIFFFGFVFNNYFLKLF